MKAGPIIERLRDNCASFSNRVFGSSEFDVALFNETVAVPAAFVVVGFNAAEEALTAGVVTQSLIDDVSVFICVDNTPDDAGASAADAVEDLMAEVWPELIGWVAATGYGGLQYRGGQPANVNRARYWHEMQFTDFKIIP